jgi:hypothetical protein
MQIVADPGPKLRSAEISTPVTGWVSFFFHGPEPGAISVRKMPRSDKSQAAGERLVGIRG